MTARHGAHRAWSLIGALGVAAGFLILSYYCVIGGWTLSYAVHTAVAGLAGTDPAAVQSRYEGMLASPVSMTLYTAAFIVLAVMVVARGVMGGVEAASKILMPPLGGFALTLFAGWCLPVAVLGEELPLGARGVLLLRWILRYLVPAGLALAALAPLAA